MSTPLAQQTKLHFNKIVSSHKWAGSWLRTAVNGNKFKIDRQQHNSTSNFVSANSHHLAFWNELICPKYVDAKVAMNFS